MMSATPIPRTLSMTYYADLDVSVIDELPPGRRPVVDRLVSRSARDEVLARIREACAEGQQAYWVCPVIEESKDGDLQTALETYETLRAELTELRVGLLHGQPAARGEGGGRWTGSRRADPAAGLHHGDRGRRRRAERVARW